MSLSPKKHSDMIIIERHGNEDARAWMIETDDPVPGLVETVNAATAGFLRRVNQANQEHPDNQYTTDRALARMIYEHSFIGFAVTVTENYHQHIIQRTNAASSATKSGSIVPTPRSADWG